MENVKDAVNAIQLVWEEEDGVVTVTPEDKDRFAIRMNSAIEILRRADEQTQFESQFTLLLRQLAEWLSGQQGVRKAHVTLRDGSLAFIVIREQSEYDEEFEDNLSALDLEIANDPDLDLISLHTLALPNISKLAMSSFLDDRFALTYTHGI